MTIDDLRTLVRLVRGDTEAAARRLRGDPLALDRLAAAAAAEGLAVVLLRALPALPEGITLSAARLDLLESKRRMQSARSAAIASSLDRLAAAFLRGGVPFMLLKGPYLGARFYGDADAREYYDLDLLVPSAHRARACRLLERAGFARRSRTVGGERLTGFFVHAFDFVGWKTGIDLHWRLTRQPSVRIDEAALWAGRGSFELAGQSFGVLSNRHDVVFHALSFLRDVERGRPKAKNILDLVQIAAALDAAQDWDALLDAGRRDGTFGPLVNVLSLCLEAADAHDLAPRLGEALARRASRRVRERALERPGHFAPAWNGLGNRWWAARAYDASPAAWFLWWAVSLPFRTAVHQRPVARPAARNGPGA